MEENKYIQLLVDQINSNLDRQEEIRKQLKNFKRGKLVIKKRGNNEYYYLEYRKDKKVKTDYLGKINDNIFYDYLEEQKAGTVLEDELAMLETEERTLRDMLKKLRIKHYRKVYTLYEIKKIIKPILKKYEVENAFVFGSYARGKAKEKSDLDLLLSRINGNKKIFAFESEIKDKLGKEIDFVYTGTKVQKQFYERISKEMINIDSI